MGFRQIDNFIAFLANTLCTSSLLILRDWDLDMIANKTNETANLKSFFKSWQQFVNHNQVHFVVFTIDAVHVNERNRVNGEVCKDYKQLASSRFVN